jgi:hypothetical protein
MQEEGRCLAFRILNALLQSARQSGARSPLSQRRNYACTYAHHHIYACIHTPHIYRGLLVRLG